MAAGWPVYVFVRPSPQSTVTRVIGLAVVLVPYVNGSVTVWPAVGVAGVGAPTVMVLVVLTLIVTRPVCAPPVGGVPVGAPTPAVADTVVVRDVVSEVTARPFASVLTTVAVNVPLPPAVPVVEVSIAKVTGTPASRLPLMSATVAVIVAVPPVDPRVA